MALNPCDFLCTGYPEDYLQRFPLPDHAIRFAIGCLISADIYSALPHYPNPSHRTTALSAQATYVFVLLFYVPQILHRDAPVMQQVVERFFSDRWVLSWAPGQVVDLGHEWERYKAARAALRNAITPAKARRLLQQHWERVGGLTGDFSRCVQKYPVPLEWVLRCKTSFCIINVKLCTACCFFLLKETRFPG